MDTLLPRDRQGDALLLALAPRLYASHFYGPFLRHAFLIFVLFLGDLAIEIGPQAYC